MRINLTGDSGSGTQTIAGPGGVSLATLAPPPGDGVSTASSTGSGGGFVGSNENSSNATATAAVSAYIAAESMSVTGNVSIKADSKTNAKANTSNSTGGFVGIGRSHATTDQSSTTKAYVADGSVIGAGGNVTIEADSNHLTGGSSTAKAGGFAADVRAYMTSTIGYDTEAYVGEGAKIVAAGHVGITSEANADADTKSYADGRGFGGGGYATSSMTISSDSQSLVDLGNNAIIIADTAALRATTTHVDLDTEAKGYGAGFVGISDASATISAQALNRTRIGSGASLTGYNGVDLAANFSDVDTYSYSYAKVTGLFGDVDSDANNTTTLTSRVIADPRTLTPRAQVTAGPRSANDPNLDNPSGDTGALPRLALYVNTTNSSIDISADADHTKRALATGGSDTDVDNNQTRTIQWNADVHVFSGQSPELVISDTGKIDKAVNISVKTAANANQTSGTIASTESEIFVNDIVNDDPGQVYFNDAGDASGSGSTGISGSGSAWDFSDTYSRVLITNNWDKPLKINNIDVVNTTANPLVDLNGKAVSLTFDIERTVAPTLVRGPQRGRLRSHHQRHDQQPDRRNRHPRRRRHHRRPRSRRGRRQRPNVTRPHIHLGPPRPAGRHRRRGHPRQRRHDLQR